MSEDRLDQVLNEMRKDNVPAEELAAARARVWDKLAGAEPDLCTEFRASFKDYLADGLESSRRLLMQDHLSRCATCRRALAEFQGPRRVVPMPPVVRRMTLPVWSRWAIAAGVGALALYLARGPIDKSMAPSGPRATVIAATGSLYHLPQGAVIPGDYLAEGEVIRTGYGGHAVLQLTDGSRVEVNERTELSLQATWSGETIRLERGDVIVQAAKQHRGRLRVVTRDSVASVKGTVFAVSAGLAGSVVAVVEGSVQVTQPAGRRLLTRGQRAASSSALEDVPVRRTVAWSENAAKYEALLGELAQIGKAVAATSTPAPRTQPKLLPYLPAGTFVYVAVPNLGPAVQQAVNLIEQRAQENTVVKEWWASADKEGLKLLAEKVQALSPLIGDEVVFVVARPLLATKGAPALLAEVQPGREDALKQALAQAVPEAKVAYQVSDKLLLISDSPEHLGVIVAGMGQGAASPFSAEIATHYQEGVNILFALDTSSVMNLGTQKSDALAATGASKLKYLFFEERPSQGKDEVRAAMVFSGPRTGVASWLGSPGPAGSVEYVSSDAVLVISAVTRSPREAFNELESLTSRIGAGFTQGLSEVQVKTGVNVGSDIVAALGTDFTFAIERPTLPIPGWFAALEVNYPSTIDSAVRSLAAAASAELANHNQAGTVTVQEQAVDGRNWVTLTPPTGPALTWTYDGGYMIISTDRAIALQAIATRNGGFPLVRSAKFQAQLPSSVGLHQSGFFWLNTQGPVADVAGLLGSGSIKTMLQSSEPILVIVNGERERIEAASRTRLMSVLIANMLAGGPGGVSGVQRRPAEGNVTRH